MVGKGLKLLIQEAHQFVKCQRLLELCVTLCHSASLLQNSFFVLRIAGLSQILVIALRHLSNSRSVPQAQVKQCVGAIRIIATSLIKFADMRPFDNLERASSLSRCVERYKRLSNKSSLRFKMKKMA